MTRSSSFAAHRVGESLAVFDPELWGGRDKGDNSQFWKLATIENIWQDEHGRTLHDVRFDHDGHLSRGHFL